VRDPFRSGKPRKIRAIDIDAWLDSSLYKARANLAQGLQGFATFLRRFRVTGVRRALAEIAGDVTNLSLGASVLLLALALPAFEATRDDWRTQGDYSITFLDRYGNEIGMRGTRHSNSVTLEEIPDHLTKAVLATEDRRFYDHFGIDVIGTARALALNLRANAVVQGGSSITQQLAKNLFLSNERTLERKIKEAYLAIWLEFQLSKSEILKLYLDRAYLGGGTFGVEAASEFYFGKSVKDVNLAEAAMLAGLFKAPTRYAPHLNLPAARARANEVLSNMVQANMMTEGQVVGARRKPADVIQQATGTSPDYFLDWAYDQVKKQFRNSDRVLTVRTTIDMNLQKAAEDAIEAALRENGERFRVSQGALVAMDPDGAVRAMVGGRDYGESQFNRATDALRQPGSSFKPIVYTAALENGFTPNSVVVDGPITIGNWSPKNYGGSYSGPMTLTNALVRSVNTVAVRLAQSVGRDKIVEVGHRLGINSELRITRSLPLGSSEVTVLDMASVYAVFANGGYKAPPYAFTQIISSNGDIVYDRRRDAPKPQRVLEEKIVAGMNSMLVQIPQRGTATRARLDGIPTAGKTGTTNAYRDAWFDGFTGNYVASIWFGNDGYAPTRRMTGGTLPAMTWKRFMAYAHSGIEIKPIPYVDEVPSAPTGAPLVAEGSAAPPTDRPLSLSVRTSEQLAKLEKLLRSMPSVRPGVPTANLGRNASIVSIGAPAAEPDAVPER